MDARHWIWTRETWRWNCGRQDSTSTAQGGEPVDGSDLQVSGSEGPGLLLNASSAEFLKEKLETQNSEFEISIFICWQLHWEDQTQQMWGLYSVLRPLITLNKITSTLSPAQSTKSNVDFISHSQSKTFTFRILAGWSTFSWSIT